MRIGMILDAPFPPDVRVEKEALTLIAAGHEVVLFCLEYKKENFKEDYNGITVVHYKSTNIEYKLSALAYTIPLYQNLMHRKIKSFIATFQPDIIHVHDMVIAAAALQAAEQWNLKVVLDLHENRPEIMKEYPHLKKFPGKFLIDLNVWRRKQIELVRHAYKVIVVTDLAKKNLVLESGKNASDIYVLPNTPSLSFSKQAIDHSTTEKMRGKFNLLYLGDTGERRGTADMIYAVLQLKDRIPGICLWIVGKSSYDDRLKSIVEEFQLERYVKFEGWKSESLFPSYIAGAEVCLSPLKRNVHHDSTFANKVFQYMAMGKPSVVSNSTAQAELILREECGLVHEAGNVTDLSEKIYLLFHDPSLRERLGENAGKAIKQKWNWEISSKAILELYSGI